jgi:hypothetical protein
MSIVLTVWSACFFPDFVRALPHAFLVLHHRLPQRSRSVCHSFLNALVFVAYVAANGSRSGGDKCPDHQ